LVGKGAASPLLASGIGLACWLALSGNAVKDF
jgi:hypothetical protein